MIVYTIGSFVGINSGRGGHYYSLMHIAEEVSKKHDVLIVNIGNFRAKPLNNWNGLLRYIDMHENSISSAVRMLILICREYDVKAVQSFDILSGYFARQACNSIKIPWVNTKTGGNNPSHRKHFFHLSAYYPYARNQTVFHQDDYCWFSDRAMKPDVLQNIIGRVKVDFCTRDNSCVINDFYSNADIRIMRIARISSDYSLSILQSINLTKRFCDRGVKAKLVIIGVKSSEDVYKSISDAKGSETLLLTEDEFINKSSDYLIHADIVVGTGRSFMEGCAAGCIVMAPVNNCKYPVLANVDNIEHIEHHNFSQRLPLCQAVNPDKDIDKIIDEILANKSILAEFAHKRFTDRYSATNGAKLYVALYSSPLSIGERTLDLFLHRLKCKYNIFRSNRKLEFLSKIASHSA